MGRVEWETTEEMEWAFRIGTLSNFWSMQAAFPHMRRQGGGRIINLCSLNGVNEHIYTVPYNTLLFDERIAGKQTPSRVLAGRNRVLCGRSQEGTSSEWRTGTRLSRGCSTASVVLVLCFLSSSALGDVVANGGFEQGVWGTYRQAQVVGGGNPPGWIVDVIAGSNPNDFTVDLVDQPHAQWVPFGGLMSLDLEGSFVAGGSQTTGSVTGSVTQFLDTVPGRSVTVRFALGGSFFGPSVLSEVKSAEVLWNGLSRGIFQYSLHAGDTPANFTWDLHEMVVARSDVLGSDLLTFRSVNPTTTGHGAVIDAVAVLSGVPVPASSSSGRLLLVTIVALVAVRTLRW